MTYTATGDRYEKMPYRRCGRNGIDLPEVSLGLWQKFGDDRPLDAQRAILRRAFDFGDTHFDLANNYGRMGVTPRRARVADLYAKLEDDDGTATGVATVPSSPSGVSHYFLRGFLILRRFLILRVAGGRYFNSASMSSR
jgi:hypothetical protein